MSNFNYPSLSFADADAASAQLLERIRELKELLHGNRSPPPVATSSRQDIRSPSPKTRQLCGPETYEPPKDMELCGSESFVRPKSKSRSFSPPTRESPVNERNNANEAKLIEETWQLLAHVTYVRVIIDKIVWDKCPKFILEEAKHQRSPREKGQIYLHYQVPSTTRLTPRGSSKTIKAVAREVSAKAVNFNHRHVSLCRMNPAMVQSWAETNLEIKFFYRAPTKTTSLCFAKCAIPLCKVLVLPFSFDSTIPMELTQELNVCKGKLKVCVQLGSRIQYFLERVEPMRNPTTAVSPITFWDPMEINAYVKPIPTDIDNIQRTAVEKHVHPLSDDETRFRDYEIGNYGETRFVSPLQALPSARNDAESVRSPWRRLYPVNPSQDSVLHNGTWKDDHQRASSRHDDHKFSHRNETFLVPDDQPPQPMTIAATSSPLPEVDVLSFRRHDIAFRSSSPSNKFVIPSTDAIVQTNSKVMVDKGTESVSFTPKKAEISTQTSKNRKKSRPKETSSESFHSSGSNFFDMSLASDHSRKKSLTVAERLKSNNLRDSATITCPPFNVEHQESHANGSLLDPFIDLTSRSFITKKLRNNMGELDDLLINIQRMLDNNPLKNAEDLRDKMQSAATSTWPVSPSSSRTVMLNQEGTNDLKLFDKD